MKKLIAIMMLCAFMIQVVNAQIVLDGHVMDTVGQPIPNVSVTVHVSGSRSIVAFGTAGIDGYYKISVNSNADSLDVKTVSAFFEKKSVSIANRSQTVDFILRDEIQELKGVIVRAQAIEQKGKRGDTIEYLVGSFVQKQDKSIEDVLKRMPGIEIEDNGKITYQGLPIEKFYVEGMDLMDGSYAAISKNLPHESVAMVEVYENHQPIKMLEDRISSNQASINIKLSKNVALTGTANIGLGATPLLWDVNITPMLFSDKMQMLAAYRTNNVGDDLAIYMNRLTFENLFNDRPKKLDEELSLKSASTPLFDKKRYLDNRTHLLNINTLVPAGKKSTLRANIYYLNDLQKQTASQTNTLYLAADTLCYTEQINNQQRDNQIFGTITLNRNEKGFYLDEKINFHRSWDNAFGIDVNNGNPVTQTLLLPAMSVDNDFRIIFPVGKRLLDFTSYVGYGQTPHRLEVEPGQFEALLNDNIPYSKINQQLDSRQFFADNVLSAIFTINRFTIQPKIGFMFVEYNLSSRMTLFNDTTSLLAVPDATVQRRNAKPYANIDMEYQRPRFSFGVKLPLSLQHVAVKDNNGKGNEMTHLILNPYIWSRIKIGNYFKFYITARLKHNIDNFDNWYSEYLLTNYQNLILYQAPLSLSRTLSSSANIEFKQPFISLNANLRYSIGQTHSENIYRYYVGDGGTTMMEVIPMPNNRIYQTLNAGVRKFILPIRTTIGIKGNVFDTRGVSLVNGKVMNTNSITYSIEPSLMFKVVKWLNFDYSLMYNKIYMFIDGTKRDDITYWRHYGKAFIFIKRNHTLNVSAEYYRHQEQPYIFVDASYEFSLKKPKLDFVLSWNNIFNSKYYVSYYSDVFAVQETLYTLRPMSVTASVRFRF